MLGMSMKEKRPRTNQGPLSKVLRVLPFSSGVHDRLPGSIICIQRNVPKMLGKRKCAALSSEKRKAHRGMVSLSGLSVLRTRLSLRGVETTHDVTLVYIAGFLPVYHRRSPRNAPSRSKIEAHKTGRVLIPTAPRGHAKGESCATLLPVCPLNGGRAGSQPAEQIRSSGIAGQRKGCGSRRNPAGPE